MATFRDYTQKLLSTVTRWLHTQRPLGTYAAASASSYSV